MPDYTLRSGMGGSVPYAGPWQETQDGALLRVIYHPGEWKKLSVETAPVCPSCGTLFRQTENHIGDLFWFEADCMEKHI